MKVFLKEISKRKINFIKTIFVFLIFSSIGLLESIYGPTVLDLQLSIGASLQRLSGMVSIKSSCYIIGSFLASFISERTDQQPIIFGVTLLEALLIASVPFSRNIASLALTMALIGLTTGCLDLCMNNFLIGFWGKHGSLLILVADLMYSMGGCFAPLIAEPFLSHSLQLNFSETLNKQTEETENLLIAWPYTIISIYTFLAAFIFGLIYCFHNKTKTKPFKEETLVECRQLPKKKATFKSQVVQTQKWAQPVCAHGAKDI
ncbi:sodium-dependent glucose transporter 1-like protein, partial [Dinothrombium tinctorium]